jgi:LCP family protein required for cell wall assembly
MRLADDTGRKPRHTRRVLLVLGVLVLLLAGIVSGGVLVLSNRIGDNVTRVPGAFTGLAERPAPTPQGTLTFLLAGSDSRASDPTTGSAAPAAPSATGAGRSDTLMIAQVSPDRRSAAVVSIPRDSWVDIPGHGMNKINAAYAFGGPGLLVQTVENLTHVRVDHFAVIDFAGFQSVVDSLGGIDVAVAAPTASAGVQFHAGVNHLDGAQALVYVRQRYDLPDGDLSRAQRQQNFLRAVLGRLTASGVLGDPLRLYMFLDAVSRSVSVDDTLTNNALRGLALDLRDLRPGAVSFLGAPVGGAGREGSQAVLYLDGTRSRALWDALGDGSVAAYAAAHPTDLLGTTPS